MEEKIIYPSFNMIWVIEVEVSHSKRIKNILNDKNIQTISLNNNKNNENNENNNNNEPILFYLTNNIINKKDIPIECCKYISRMFYLPHSCYDMKQIHYNQQLLQLIQLNATFKILASPKTLEKYIAELLIWDEDEDGYQRNAIVPPSNVHPSKYTHIVQVVYSQDEGLFRWGIVSKEQAIEWNLLTTSLLDNIEKNENLLDIPPICRAYYKIQEIITHHLPLWNWILPNYDQSYSIDIGSSPGGWTQYLIPYCRHILSIDPGKMNSKLFSQKNKYNQICMKHIPHLAESFECRKEMIQLTCEPYNNDLVEGSLNNSIENEQGIKLNDSLLYRIINPLTICVCDVNFEPHLAAEMISNCIIPFMKLNEIVSEQISQDLSLSHTKYRFQTLKNNISSSTRSTTITELELELEESKEINGNNNEMLINDENIEQFYSYIILTLKLQKNPSEKIIQKSFLNVKNIISAGFQTNEKDEYKYNCEFKMIFLNANSKNERTVVCRIRRTKK